ncbi:DUF5131 family protein [Alicyclobacillus macrosporangiidus]|uniref:DUF5131 family protein n=1 Tax=Alicyclobacillus macrosporangiidus TaxID=392015 RepID=UPI0004981F02|nr:phage Gp37/Gp68 family protein [Alicyclobacillus macrosporangiidus]
MSVSTTIEWTDTTWNVITGCSKVSEGCRHCYAETVDRRFAQKWGHEFKPWTGPNAAHNVRLHPERLTMPLHWRKPRKVFVNSMSDLFHEQVPDNFLDEVFGVILACRLLENRPDHVFQILTKRPRRMLAYFTERRPDELVRAWAQAANLNVALDDPDVIFSEYAEAYVDRVWPLPNVWLGVSVENQQAADERIPLLLQTPAAVRFLSCEPLLGPVDLSEFKPFDGECYCQGRPDGCKPGKAVGCPENAIDWVIVGGESGPNARPMHPDWVESLRDQCQAVGVPFFFKQWGEFVPVDWVRASSSGFPMRRVGKKAAGRMLDGRTWDEYPEVTV